MLFLFTAESDIFSQSIIPISEVRKIDANGEPVLNGQVVTIQGEVTVTTQFGITASIQDETAGVAVYDGDFATFVNIGDYVLVHAGFVLEKIDQEEAKKTLQLFNPVK